VIVIVLAARKRSGAKQIIYLVLMFISYLALMVVLKWRPTGSRWHLTYFVMFAPLAGIVLDWIDSKRKWLGTALAFVLLFVSTPWLLAVQERPLLPVQGYTYPRSILTTSRESLYFSSAESEEIFYSEVAELINAVPGNQQLGLLFDTPFLEHPIWALTDQGEGQTKIAYLWANGASQKYLSPKSQVDFILTDRCDNTISFPGFSFSLKSSQGKCLYQRESNP
jgi:hypothetical protein